MQVSNILNIAQNILAKVGIPSALLDAKILLSHVTGKTNEELFLYPHAEINEMELAKFWELIKQREMRQPISHLIGKREFYGREFKVTKHTLDPRADTETLIDAVKQNYSNTKELHFLDLGTGTGCIPITLLKEFPESSGFAIDISEEALKVATLNAHTHQVNNRLKLIKSNFFTELAESQKFDLIVSNPPYIPSKDIESLEMEVRHFEPKLALDGGIDGLECYKEIAKQAHKYLKQDGKIFVEIGYNQENEISEIFQNNNFVAKSYYKDLAGIIRVLEFSLI